MGALLSGAPFAVYSGIQQTGHGSNNADRPDALAEPVLSTSRAIREDYFGNGPRNSSFLFIPINLPNGTGPNRGRHGSLGRNTYRGPALHNFHFSLITNTALGPHSNPEHIILQARLEVINAFNIVNFSLPANIVMGPGFGIINRTATPSRQIQLFLKLLY